MKLKVAIISNHYKPDFEDVDSLLKKWFTYKIWIKALSESGFEVSFISRFKNTEHIENKGVNCYLYKDTLSPILKFYRIPFSFYRSIKKYNKADIYILDNINDYLKHYFFSRRKFDSKIFVIYHSENANSKFPILQKIALSKIDKFLFSAKGQETKWIKKNIIKLKQIDYVLESSSTFVYHERNIARNETKLEGNPIFIWVGNLIKAKGYISVLEAFKVFFRKHPNAKLYMIYRLNQDEEKVKAIINKSIILSENVILLGAKSHYDLEMYYNSADFYISGSYREGSGYAAIEAMSCGCIPILTNIPSFNLLTRNGQIGSLWTAGKSTELISALEQNIEKNIEQESKKVLKYFEKNLSPNAIAKNILRIYKEISQK
ncbi:MAG: glycosyltransferase family 4 protein [Bacteroidales bacterium]|nr:glycosyltransferase family 4 protein [Bacteroidales bacterium]MBN2757930.1 glycosyltransferase family 4 protein [Bacteroidales bacterium]